MATTINTQPDGKTEHPPKTISVKLDPEVARSLRILGAEEDRSVPDIIREGLEFYWEAKYRAKRGDIYRKPIPAPEVEEVIPASVAASDPA